MPPQLIARVVERAGQIKQDILGRQVGRQLVPGQAKGGFWLLGALGPGILCREERRSDIWALASGTRQTWTDLPK